MAKRYGEIECLRAQVVSRAVELFEGDRQMAQNWLSKHLRAIGNEIPTDYIDSPERAQHLLDIIGRLEHGIWT